MTKNDFSQTLAKPVLSGGPVYVFPAEPLCLAIELKTAFADHAPHMLLVPEEQGLKHYEEYLKSEPKAQDLITLLRFLLKIPPGQSTELTQKRWRTLKEHVVIRNLLESLFSRGYFHREIDALHFLDQFLENSMDDDDKERRARAVWAKKIVQP